MFRNHGENVWGRSVPDLFLSSKKALWGKSKLSVDKFQDILIALNLAYNKHLSMMSIFYRKTGSESLGMKVSGNSFSTKYVYHVILFTKFYCLIALILWDIAQYMYCNYICFPGGDIINFENNLIFLTKLFFYMTIKSRQKFKYPENKKSF